MLDFNIHIHPLERKWIYAASAVIGIFLGSIILTALFGGIHPPGHMEVVDWSRLHLEGEFTEDKLGVKTEADSSVHVTLVAARYGFYPRDIEVPADTPITFRIASADVMHGMHAPMTNLSTMVVPGYISTVKTQFPKPGEYPMLCNEYCGMGHDHMWSRMTVVSKESWNAAHPTPAGR